MAYPSNGPEMDELPPPSAEFDALSMMAEAYMVHVGQDEALQYLHILASHLERAEACPIPLRLGVEGARSQRFARAWLRRNITLWLGRHG